MNLKDKITSKEQLLEHITNQSFRIWEQELATKVSFIGSDIPTKVHWWAVREMARVAHGVYEMTDALTILNQHRQVFAHVSSEDRNMVAFTPDAVFGAADKQLRISFAKLMTRLIPFAADDYVRDLNAWHMSELSNEVEWVEGLAIAEEYSKDTSVGACMSSKTNFEIQPTVAYANTGIKMAVIRGVNGELKARAMVYENHDKKVYIRAYGNPVLKKRLERLGYKAGSWEGATFNTVFLSDDEYVKANSGMHKVVIPYLDANGSTCTAQYSSVALIDMKLVCLPHAQHVRYRNLGGNLAVPSTQGYVSLRNVDSSSFQVEDYFTKKKLNTMLKDYAKLAVVDEHNVAKLYAYNEADYLQWLEDVEDGKDGVDPNLYPDDMVKANIVIGGNTSKVWVSRASTFDYRYAVYVNDISTRQAHGFTKLSKTFYPDSQGWELGTVKITDAVGAEHNILRDDCVAIASMNPLGEMYRRLAHKSVVTKEMTRLHTYNKLKCYAEKGVKVWRTPSGAKVSPEIHTNLSRTFEGFDFDRNVKRSETILGETVYISKGTDLTRPDYVKYCEELFEIAFQGKLNSAHGDYVEAAYQIYDRDYYYRIWPLSGFTSFTSAVYMSEASTRITSTSAVTEYMRAVVTIPADKWKKKAWERLSYMHAEACALEYPVRAEPVQVEQAVTETAVTPPVIITTSEERFALVA